MHYEVFKHFLDEGLIERVIRPIKSGKEASVHLVRANPRTTGEELAALKLYHPLDRRDFRDESLYRDGEFIKERRIRVALEKKTRFGRQVQGGIWVGREWETLHALFAAEAEDLFEQCIRAVERMLFHDVVHGDLSPFNILVWDGRISVIDLPQAVDPKKNRHAEALLARDIERVCEHFARRGVAGDPARIAGDLWTAWTFADLVPEELRLTLEVDPAAG